MGNVDENYPLNSSLPTLVVDFYTSFYFQAFFKYLNY